MEQLQRNWVRFSSRLEIFAIYFIILEFLGHGVRTKLDEVKRQEMERLRHMAQKQFEAKEGIDRKHFKIPQHIDVKTANFDVSDLQKLIKQTTADLVSGFYLNL